MNQKGVFITLTAFVMSLLLISISMNIQESRTVTNNSASFLIAGNRTANVRENLTDAIKDIYSQSNINWDTDNNILRYTETFPNTTAKGKISTNLTGLKNFFFQEFQSSNIFAPESIDLGKIIVYGKDFNISHSTTTGFGTNLDIYGNYTKQFSRIKFDVNTASANINNTSDSITICSGCTNPLTIEIIVREADGTVEYTYSNTIDLDQTNTVSIGVTEDPGNGDITFSIDSGSFVLHTDSTIITLGVEVEFNDPVFEVGIDKSAIQILEVSGFGFKG